MKKNGYYSSGEFAKLANVTLRTIRYYDNQNILKPSYVNDSGARFYTDEDLAKLQQILLFKYLGFSLHEIREMTLDNFDRHFILQSLDIQKKLIQNRIEHMSLVLQAIEDTWDKLHSDQEVDWAHMMNLIHLTSMEKSMKNQYQNAANISARIQLHQQYSTNKQGWFPWLYEQAQPDEHHNILEIGCGDGTLWIANASKIPPTAHITLTDISDGMLRDARRNLSEKGTQFSYAVADASHLPYEDESFDRVLANHVLFYCDDIEKVCSEIRRVLKPNGLFLASTYGEAHMQEISELVEAFDSRIVLSAEKLYHRFGKENGTSLLSSYFSSVTWKSYEDSLIVPDAEPLISYILSCHGNQNQYLLNRYNDFRNFVEKKVAKGLKITKDAGTFLIKK